MSRSCFAVLLCVLVATGRGAVSSSPMPSSSLPVAPPASSMSAASTAAPEPSPTPTPAANSSSAQYTEPYDLTFDSTAVQDAYVDRLFDACINNGNATIAERCCAKDHLLGYVRGELAYGSACVPSFRNAGCYGGLYSLSDARGSLVLVTDATDPFALAPPGFVSPNGFHCLMACTQGAYCPGYTANTLFNLTEDLYASFPNCANQLFTSQSSACCAGDAQPPISINTTDGRAGVFCTGFDTLDSPCPRGYYCPTPSTILVCPSGYVCGYGTTTPKKCNVFSTCSEGTERQTHSALAPILVVIGLTALTVLMSTIWRKDSGQAPAVSLEAGAGMATAAADDNVLLLPEYALKAGADEPGDAPDAPPAVGVTFTRLTAHVGRKAILQDCTGVVRAGKMTALMGNSGCGKSSLLNVLSGRAPYARKAKEGVVQVTDRAGRPVHVPSARARNRLFGYVPQDDILYRYLTVAEALFFQAALRLPVDYDAAARRALLEEMLTLLKLQGVRNTIVGGEGGDRARISGGQLRRLSLGLELMAQPKVLFLDECTSGLDAASSFSVMAALNDAVRRTGVTAVAVIHQPRYEIFAMFDDIILLSEGGRIVFSGPARQAPAYLESLGFTQTPGTNPADFIVDALNDPRHRLLDLPAIWRQKQHEGSGVPSNSAVQKETAITAAAAAAATAAAASAAVTPLSSLSPPLLQPHLQRGSDSSVIALMDFAEQQTLAASGPTTASAVDSSDVVIPPVQYRGRVAQFVVQLRRNLFFAGHRRREIVFDYVILILGSALMGALSLDPSFSEGPPTMSMFCLILGALAMTSFLRVLTRAEREYWRERACGVSSLAFFTATMLFDLFHDTIMAVLASATLFALLAPAQDWGLMFMTCWGFIFCVNGQAYAMSAFVASSMTTVAGMGLVGVQVLVSGASPKLSTLDDMTFVGPALYTLSAAKWLVEAFVVEERNASPEVMHYAYDTVIEEYGFVNAHGAGFNMGMLVLLGLGWRAAAVFAFMFIRKSLL